MKAVSASTSSIARGPTATRPRSEVFIPMPAMAIARNHFDTPPPASIARAGIQPKLARIMSAAKAAANQGSMGVPPKKMPAARSSRPARPATNG